MLYYLKVTMEGHLGTIFHYLNFSERFREHPTQKRYTDYGENGKKDIDFLFEMNNCGDKSCSHLFLTGLLV